MGAIALAGLGRARAESPEDEAARALRELRVADARALLDASLRSGGLPRARLIAVRALLGEALCILEGPEAGEREFRRLLTIDPDHAPPPRRSPVVAEPFERARRFIAQNGAIKATGAALDDKEVEVRVSSDHLAMVVGARIYLRSGAGPYQVLPGTALHAILPADRGEPRAWYAELIDAADNVLLRVGSPDQPQLVPGIKRAALPAPPPRLAPAREPLIVEPPVPRPRLWPVGVGVGAAGVGLLAVAIGLDLGAVAEYNGLSRSCGVSCTDAQLGTFRAERNLSYVGYSLAGGALVAATVLVIVDGVRAAAVKGRGEAPSRARRPGRSAR